MKESRLFLAFALSLLILFFFNLFFYTSPQTGHQKTLPQTGHQKKLPATLTLPTSTEEIVLENDFLKLTFSKEHGFIKEVRLKNFSETLIYKNLFFVPNFRSKRVVKNSNSILFEGDSMQIGYKIDGYSLKISLKNTENSLKKILLFEKYPDKEKINQRFVEVFYKKEKLYRRRGNIQVENFSWGGIRGRYFCFIFQPNIQLSWIYKKEKTKFVSFLFTNSSSLQIESFLGPQIKELLPRQWQEVVYYGFFGNISKFILRVLGFLYKIFKNWGVAIIVLTVLIYILLLPFTIKTTKSMLKMQEIQPEIEKLKKQYKDNLQKLNKEILELYREYNINPASGCLPLFFQIPIFIGLYQALMRAIELKGAKFLWIKDLSLPDRSIIIGNTTINILPILTALLFFFQQKISSIQTPSEQKRFFEIFFPVFFGFIFYYFPSGFLLYWLSNSLLTLLYYLKLKKSKNVI